MRNGHVSMVRKRYLLQAVIGSFFCSLATASASEPTLQETLNFIERKTQGMCPYSVKDNEDQGQDIYSIGDYTITLLDDDKILIKARHIWRSILNSDTMRGFVDRLATIKTKFRLADLSTQVNIRATIGTGNQPLNEILVECTEKNCIEYQVTNRKMSYDYRYYGKRHQATEEDDGEDEQKLLYSSIVPFRICSPDVAERIQKALTYTIKLSGGKDELF